MAKFKVGDVLRIKHRSDNTLLYIKEVSLKDHNYRYRIERNGITQLENWLCGINPIEKDYELHTKKVANTEITRKLYKDKIIEETAGHLVIKLV